jgi:hypothetical protein
VNVLTDHNNCGMVGHKCNATHHNCSNGVCHTVPVVPLNESKIMLEGFSMGISDYAKSYASLPLNLTLYGETTRKISVMWNGVSLWHITHTLWERFQLINRVYRGDSIVKSTSFLYQTL